jgi:hypothetical protein
MNICIVCGEEIKDVYMYDSDDLFCSDDCKEVNKEDEIERLESSECGHCKGECVMNEVVLIKVW